MLMISPTSPLFRQPSGHKKSGGHVLNHLSPGSGKTTIEMNLETVTPRPICSRISARGRMHTCYIIDELILPAILR